VSVPFPKALGDLVRYSHRIFYHLIRVVYVVTAIIKKQPRVLYKDSIGKATGQPESTLATIQVEGWGFVLFF
jgi:hypothetical protein